MQIKPESSLEFACGLRMKNRFSLAPMTNKQSHEDGRLSDDEMRWLVMRAKGEFGMVMTCASHIQEVGKGFSGQLGIFSDDHIPGHKKLTAKLKSFGSIAVIQLHHAGMRSPEEIIKQKPVCPSDNKKHNARALSLNEVIELKKDFIFAAKRAQESGYHGVEVHGAHGYVITQFLSKTINRRTDYYGGSLENRTRLLFEIVKGIRKKCGEKFLLGVRLSPEKFGMDISEVKLICNQLCENNLIDFLDVSLWDCFKNAEDEAYQETSLLEHFTSLNLNKVKLTVAGKIKTAEEVHDILNAGVDFVSIGRSAILHHDFPTRVINDPSFEPVETPVSEAYLTKEGLNDTFVKYMSRWSGFVKLND